MPSPLRRWTSSPASVMDTSPVHGDDVTAALLAVPGYCEVIDGHLHDVIDQTEDAAQSILEQLTKVDSMAEVMAADVNELAGALGRTEAQLSDVTASNDRLVERLIRYFLHRDEQIRNLVEEMRGLSKHVNQIEEVSRSTNILALNAMIEAVRAGEAGEGFAVVADEVRKLADRSAKAAQGIGSSITDLTTRLDSVLGDETAVDSDVDLPTPTGAETAMTRRLAGISQAQREMSQVVVAILQDTMSAAEQVERSSDALTAETVGAVGHVQFQDICRQMLEHIAGAVADVRRQSEDVIAYAEGDLPSDAMLDRKINLDELRGRHVMGRQRLTHAESTGESSATTDEPAIELF